MNTQAVGKALRTAPPTAWFGMIVILAYIAVAFLAPVIAPYGCLLYTSDAADELT